MHRGRTLDLVLECSGRCESCVQRKKKKRYPRSEVSTKASPLCQNCPPSVPNSDQRNWDFFLEERFLNCSVNEKTHFQNLFHKIFELLKHKHLKLVDLNIQKKSFYHVSVLPRSSCFSCNSLPLLVFHSNIHPMLVCLLNTF